MPSLFDSESLPGSREPLQEGAVLFRGFVLAEALALLEEVVQIAQAAPFRHSPVGNKRASTMLVEAGGQDEGRRR